MAHPKDKIETLRHDFEKAVAGYVAAFLKQFDLRGYYCYWVGDRIGVDLFCFNDQYAVNLDQMIYIVEEGVTYEEFVEWEDYCTKCREYNLPTMNLESWHKGCPRIPQSTFDRLDGLKKDLNEAIKNEQEKY